MTNMSHFKIFTFMFFGTPYSKGLFTYNVSRENSKEVLLGVYTEHNWNVDRIQTEPHVDVAKQET